MPNFNQKFKSDLCNKPLYWLIYMPVRVTNLIPAGTVTLVKYDYSSPWNKG